MSQVTERHKRAKPDDEHPPAQDSSQGKQDYSQGTCLLSLGKYKPVTSERPLTNEERGPGPTRDSSPKAQELTGRCSPKEVLRVHGRSLRSQATAEGQSPQQDLPDRGDTGRSSFPTLSDTEAFRSHKPTGAAAGPAATSAGILQRALTPLKGFSVHADREDASRTPAPGSCSQQHPPAPSL